jgi:hypothetical protein
VLSAGARAPSAAGAAGARGRAEEMFEMDEEGGEEERRRRMEAACDRAWEMALASADAGAVSGPGAEAEGAAKKKTGRKHKQVLVTWG